MSRPRKPTLIRALEGNRSRRPLRKDELAGVPGVLRPPGYLTDDQRARWADIIGSLPEALLSRADEQVLERMAVAWATFRQTTILINTAGLLTRGANNEPQRNPLLIVRNAAAQEMEACGMALGLSPLARTRLTEPTPAVGAGDPLDLLLGSRSKKTWDEDGAGSTARN